MLFTDYSTETLNRFLNETVKTSDDFAMWNTVLFLSGNDNKGENFRANAIKFLETRGWKAVGPLEIARV